MLHRRQRSTTTMVEVAASSFPQRRRTPSFSSSLLDAIYHSIDESKSHLHQHQQLGISMGTPYTTTTTKHNNHGGLERRTIKERMDLRRAVMLEDWIDKHTSSSSSSSSSECSSGRVFSSSETDTSTYNKQHKRRDGGGSFARTKLRAMKIYGELNQRVKQPISPGTGSRIASFLSSIFSSENVKKAKMCYVGAVEDVSFDHHSSSSSKSKSPPCFSSSSASSFSTRSCMMSNNKTTTTPPSSNGKTSNNNNNGGVKRSVRFYPVSVILGEDSQPCGHKCIYQNDPSLLPLPTSFKKNNNSTENGAESESTTARARGFIKGKYDFRGIYDGDDDDDDDDDDGMSCSSSDLFELDHLIGSSSAAGIRYNEELPVYETTNLETNKAIANALRF